MSATMKQHQPHHTRTKTPHTNPSNIPSIRLISATPSASGSAAGGSETSCIENQRALEDAWAAIASAPASAPPAPTTNGIGLPLAPKVDVSGNSSTGAGGRLRTTSKKLIPKKSKLSLSGLSTLSTLASSTARAERTRARDFSDVVRRVGADCSAEGGFEIYVDPEVSDGLGSGEGEGEVMVVNLKKGGKKRAGLEGVGWGAKDVGNMPKEDRDGKKEGEKGLLKVKGEEGGKWWSIGRGRKDSKEEKREKENSKMSYKPIEYIHDPNPRSKTPEPFKQESTRSRFNSLGAAVLLKNQSPAPTSTPTPTHTGPVKFADEDRTPASSIGRSTTPTPTLARSMTPTPTLTRSVTPTAGGLLAPPGAQTQTQGMLNVPGSAAQGQGQAQGSIALRAMRSVRSMARIGSWAQLKNMPAPGEEGDVNAGAGTGVKEKKKGTVKEKKGKENAGPGEEGKKEKEKKEKEKKEKKKSVKVKKNKSEKEKVKEKEKAATVRLSSSSFEAGALTSSPGPAPVASPVAASHATGAQTLGPKKHSILGLGLPSSMRLPSIGNRVASTASSITPSIIGAPQRLSADLSGSGSSTTRLRTPTNSFGSVGPIVIAGAQGQERRASLVSSAGSSLRPLSVTSTAPSRASSRSSGGSVRWDEEGLETVRERRNAEREARRMSTEDNEDELKTDSRRTSRESKHSVEGRRRTSVKAIFPEYPILTIEEATLDGHSPLVDEDDDVEEAGSPIATEATQTPVETPVKKVRARPLSEQLLGKSRPKPMHEDGDEGVLSILDAATNDLALLINNLDLQATPSTPGDMTPLRPFDLTPTGSATSTGTGKSKSATVGKGAALRMMGADSPLKSASKLSQGPLSTMSSVSSLRPYAQSRGYIKPATSAATITESAPNTIRRNATIKVSSTSAAAASNNANANAAIIAKQIAPWATLMQGLSPVKEKVKAINAKSSSNTSSPTPTLSASTSSKMSMASVSFRPGHKRTMTPAREPEPEVVFQPLRPARSKVVMQPQTIVDEEDESAEDVKSQLGTTSLNNAARSSTFGRTSKLHLTSSIPDNGSTDDFGAPMPSTASGRLTPVFKRIHEDEQAREMKRSKGALQLPSEYNNRLSTGSTASYLSVSALTVNRPRDGRSPRSTVSASSRVGSVASSGLSTGIEPLTASLSAREKRRVLGMSGTLGGSDVSAYHSEGADAEDSDVPEELREILAYSDREDTDVVGPWGDDSNDNADAMDVDEIEVGRGAIAPTSLGAPPSIPLPTPTLAFQMDDTTDLYPLSALDYDQDQDHTNGAASIDFDWTGELNALNESGASDRRSFVEQLEHAFRTPAKGLGLDLGWVGLGGLLGVPGASAPPPLPKMPMELMQAKMKATVDGEMEMETKRSKAAVVAESWRMAVEAETSTSSMGVDEDEEEERKAAYEYDSGAFCGVVQEGAEGSSAMEGLEGWKGGSMLRDMEMPTGIESQSQSQSQAQTSSQNQTRFDLFPQSQERLADVRAPSPLDDSANDSIFNKSTSSKASSGSRPSEGELDTSFRFGGLPESLRKETAVPRPAKAKIEPPVNAQGKPLTLSDIIPPPAHARRLSMAMDVDVSKSDSFEFDSSAFEDSEVIRDIYAHLMNPQSARLAAAAAATAPPKEALSKPPAETVALARPPAQAQMQQVQARGGHREEAKRRSIYKAPSRPASGISFTGLGDSFEEARRNFEFANDRPAFYPPANNSASYNTSSHSYASQSYTLYSYVSSRAATRRTGTGTGARYAHGRMESVFSIASVESYGRVINAGKPDPFDFDMMPSLRERPSSETMSAVGSMGEFEDTFAFRREMMGGGGHGVPGSIRGFSFGGAGGGGAGGLRLRQRVESDASTFSFHAPAPLQTGKAAHHHHRRRESNMSVASLHAPPISLYNRSFPHNHRRTDSASSAGSYYGHHSRSHSRGVIGNGIHAWARHRRDMSDSSMGSEFSSGYVANLGRPGVGDKMFGAGDRDSSYSERFDRPGVGEKMFDGTSGAADLGPLTSIMASPSESFAFSEEDIAMPRGVHQRQGYDSMLAYDSIMDGEPRSYEDSDSIFGQITRAGIVDHGIGMQEASRDSVASEEVFGDYGRERGRAEEGGVRLQPPVIQSRRWSVDNTGVLGMDSGRSDEDTMLSMLGGGQEPIRRQSILESPCPRVEKRKFSAVASQGMQRLFKGKDASDHYESPTKARIVEKPSLASASSFQFGGDRMIKAQHGLLERQSLEDSCLVADGEELARTYFTAPVFTRPGPATRSRSSTCTTSSSGSGSGTDTPPLSSSTGGETPPLLHHSDASSVSGGSQSSIDLTQIDIALSHATSPHSGVLNRQRSAHARQRARGAGHRRRYSAQHMSRSSVYETIEEDAELAGSQQSSPSHTGHLSESKKSSPTTTMTMRQAVFVVDSDTASFDDHSQGLEESVWSDEKGIMALRKYYALRDEAQNTVSESRRMWSDTPFSLFAIQTFEAPAEPAGMQALLEYSVQNYGPLPSELRPRRIRSRTSSRASPYPHARTTKATMSPDQTRTSKASTASTAVLSRPAKSTVDSTNSNDRTPGILQPKTLTNRNSSAPSLEAIKPFSPIVLDNTTAKNMVEPKRENAFGLAPDARPRVPSNARRTALGWAKRSTGKSSTDQKENQAASGLVMTPGDNLRLNRPRPRGRPTPAGRTPAVQNRAIRL